MDRENVARVLIALGWIGLEAPRVAEIDINPLAVVDGSPIAVDATVVLSRSSNTA
jgi:hypothetical protein